MAKTLKELIDEWKKSIDDRIDFLGSMTNLFGADYDKELRQRIKELEWVRRMMKAETTIIDDKKYCVSCGEEILK